MDKLRFEFVIKAIEDPKTNIICINSITTASKQTFIIPEHFQPAKLHEAVIRSQGYQKVKATLQKRHEKRQVWISVTEEIKNTYIDEDGNMQFKGYLLEEFITQQEPSIAGISEQTLTRILETFSEKKTITTGHRNVKKISEKFVLEKFTLKTSNALQWTNIFEGECNRLGIEEDIDKIEILRLFLDEPCLNWYNSMLIKHSINSKWAIWKENFCDSYTNKGWTPIRYALSFKYIQGSLMEYALKKERLLLEINKSIDKATLIDLIATGLPNFISDRIERNSLTETNDLFKNIRGLEHLVNKKDAIKKTVTSFENKAKEKIERIKPCTICENENKGIRYHRESLCWFKNKTVDRPKIDKMKNINHSELLEAEFSEMDPKN